MKKLLIMAALALLPLLAGAQNEPVRRGTNRSTNNHSNTNQRRNNSGQNRQRQQQNTPITPATQTATVFLCPNGNHPHAIDLGLPLGTKWACCNVGSSKPEDYGSYFAWGETTTKSTYDWSTYRWCSGAEDKLKKYNYDSSSGIVDNHTQLELYDDAARANWRGSWRMPTKVELEELVENCNYEWTSVNDVTGYMFTSRSNGRSIFLPAAGNRWDSELDGAGSYGDYWSSALDESDPSSAWGLGFSSDDAYWGNYYRGGGLSVRPVR